MTEERASTQPQNKSFGSVLYSWIEPYLRPEMAAMLLLGFASGLPLYLVYQKTSFWLREEGIELSTIGFFYWLGMAYSFKFLWAPVIDKFEVPVLHNALGRRRSWMIVSILGTVLGLLTISSADPSENLWPAVVGAFFLAFSGATLDVSIDAWRIESAPNERQAHMAASYSLGYRGAAFFSGLGLVIAGFANWNISFVFMATTMAICALLVLVIREPNIERIRREIDNLPLLAGPTNAVAVGIGLLVVARVCTWLGLTQLYLVEVLTAVAILILLAGPTLLKATKITFVYRAQLVVAGIIFIYSRQIWQSLVGFEDDSRWLSLTVLLTNIGVIIAVIFILISSYRNQKAAGKIDPEQARGKLYELFATPFKQVFDRYGVIIIPILILVSIYRLSDFTMGVMANPLYADLQYAAELVGTVQSFGVFATIFGLFLGGIAAHRFGIMRSMIIGAAITLITNAAYAWFAATAADSPDTWRLIIAVCADNVAGGFVTTVFIAYLSSLVDPAFAATQYALFSSLYAMLNKFAAGFSGVLADAVGYINFFLITASYAIPAGLLVMYVMHLQAKKPAPESLEAKTP